MKTLLRATSRKFAIVGHASSGSPLRCEAMLLCGVRDLGRWAHRGWLARSRLIKSKQSRKENGSFLCGIAAAHTAWAGKSFNISDTPGYCDF